MQLLIGHGPFAHYWHRFNLAEIESDCVRVVEKDTSDHGLYWCMEEKSAFPDYRKYVKRPTKRVNKLAKRLVSELPRSNYK